MTACVPTYIVAARRTALGHIGGLHRRRRIAELAGPLIGPVLADAGLQPGDIGEVVIGNATEGANPARLIALAGGLPESVPAATIDRQEASGLDAIIVACRSIAAGQADAVLAGGAESLSTAPWRIARPRSPHHLPRFIGTEATAGPGQDAPEAPAALEAEEAFALIHKIGRAEQDAYALRDHLRAAAARQARRIAGEIVALRSKPEETRDEMAAEPSLDDLEDIPPFLPPDGTLTPGNVSAERDGAALVAVVSQARWEALGRPPALRFTASRALGLRPGAEASAGIAAAAGLLDARPELKPALAAVELGLSSAAQAIVFAAELGFDPDVINADGGSLALGRAGGATGAVLAVRLFWRLKGLTGPGSGLIALGARGGLGVAAAFEIVRG